MSLYLVTGGCGFIGSHLCDFLINEGHQVRILDNLSTGTTQYLPPQAEFIKGDIRDSKLIKEVLTGVDGCFHLAAIVSVDESNHHWLRTHEVNLTASINIFNAARQLNNVPIVYASSTAVYGDLTELPLKENANCRPLSAYGADKLGCELHARVANYIHNVPNIGLRIFNVYGPRQNLFSPYSGVISQFLVHFFRNEPLEIFGDGEQMRDFVYVDDVVTFLYAAMTLPDKKCEVVNVCRGEGTTINDLAHILSVILQKKPTIKYFERRFGDVKFSIGSTQKTFEKFGFTPQTNLISGLKKLIDYLSEEKH